MTILVAFGISAAVGGWCWWRINGRLLQDAFSPLLLLFFSWILPLSATAVELSRLQRPWHVYVVLSLAWITLALVLSSVAVAFRLGRSDALLQSTGADFGSQLCSRGLLQVVLTLYVVGFAGYLYNEFITNPVGIPLVALIQDPSLERLAYHRWGKGGGATVASLLAALVPLLSPVVYWIAFEQRSPRRRALLLALVLAYPVMAALKLSRIDIVTTGVTLGAAEYYRRRLLARRRTRLPSPGRRRLYILLGVLLLVALVPLAGAFSKLRAGFADMSDLYVGRLEYSVDLPPALQSLVGEAYFYFALPFENFADWVRNYNGPPFLGVGALRPVASVLGMGRDVDAAFEYAIGDYRVFPINTYPFATTAYFEYGYLSLVVVPIFYALVVNGLYLRFRRRPTVLSAGLYLNCLVAWILLFGAAGLSVLTFYLNIATLGLIVAAAAFLDWFRQVPAPAARLVEARSGE